jgi:hypothetical protein
MIEIVRPGAPARPAGLLGYEQFQSAYVTNDMDLALERFRRDYNLQNWTIPDVTGIKIALAWTQGQQIEIIDPLDSGNRLYTDWIADHDGFVLRFHHLGYFVHDDAEWSHLKVELAARRIEPASEIEVSMLKAIYIHAPELGHYLVYIYPNSEGTAFFESVAAN